jgi:hypothetical protein
MFYNYKSIFNNASNQCIKLKYVGKKNTPTVPHFIKFGQKIIEQPIKCLKYTGLSYNLDLRLYCWSGMFCWCPKFYKIYSF